MPPLTPSQIQIVKATVPALEQHGETITRHFYQAMFAAHPELLNIFNPANQQTGRQARSLAASVLAYAAHIDQPGLLGGMVGRIAHKHVSLDVLPEHYPIVGEHLLKAIAAVLGDAATPEIMDAWAAAYGQLADLMISVEKDMYDQGAAQPGGWRGFKPFRVAQKREESSVITSFTLEPVDGQPLPPFLPGQYLSVQLQAPGRNTSQIRQYSLSAPSNGRSYRIAVKRELPSDPTTPGGLISNHLQDHVEAGDELLIHLPAGDFVLQNCDRPVVLLSGGVGITPMLSMLHALAGTARPTLFVHAALGHAAHAFRDEVNALAREHANIRTVVYYTHPTPEDQRAGHYDESGLISASSLQPHLPAGEAEYYYCGPEGFTRAVEGILDHLNVPAALRFTETFGPSQTFEPVLSQ